MKKVLIYFGSKGYEASMHRLFLSARDYFDRIMAYTEEDIDADFYNTHQKIFSHIRGWGYWLWKPYFILKTLSELDEGDFCFYVDSTAVFHYSPDFLFELCAGKGGILLFDNATHINCKWTKADCFNLMGLTGPEYVYGKQADASMQLYQKNEASIQFISEVLLYATNYNIISDAPNIIAANHGEFKEHRHDQSVLSLLAIKYGIALAGSPRRDGNYPANGFNKIIELKRDVIVPGHDLRQINGFLSKTIFREMYDQPFPCKPFYNSHIQFFSFYLYIGLLKVYCSGKILPGILTGIDGSLAVEDNQDTEPAMFFDSFFTNNQAALLSIVEDCYHNRPHCTWLRDWENICIHELSVKGYSTQVLLLLMQVIDEQLSFPASHLPDRIKYLQRLLEPLYSFSNS